MPVPYREKGPKIKAWQRLRIGKADLAKYFDGKKQNFGVILGIKGLADVDLDCNAALWAAQEFLPPTECVWGRKSRPESHRLFWLDHAVPSSKFEDPLRKLEGAEEITIAELRCLTKDGKVGLQTIAPSSTHQETGERIEFDSQGDPSRVNGVELRQAVADTAAAVLIGRYWPQSGRNEAFLALAGSLARSDYPVEKAVRMHRAIYRVIWHSKANLAQAEREVRATYDKFSLGKSTTGFSRLTELLPTVAAVQALAWLGVQGAGADVPSGEPPATDAGHTQLTDLGNAERLVERHGQDLRWCDAWKAWVVWDGSRWVRDNQLAVRERAHDTVRAIYAEASKISDQDQRKAVADHARRSESHQRIESMILEARPKLAVTPDQFDTDKWLLNVANGTIDLRTGELRSHRREDLITKLADVEYHTDPKCLRWKRFLKEVFEPHPDVIPFLQRAVGYSLTGDTREECLFLLHGAGRNGKGTFVKTFAEALGDYSGTADFSAFLSKRDDGPRMISPTCEANA